VIPTDLAARLRLLAEASFFDSEPPVQGTARVREIQARLPQLLPGQQFTAQITRALPDNTFQAIVAGREYTLALNHPAKAGDALELVVTRNTANAVFARVVGEGARTQNPANVGVEVASRPSLSPTGRLISFLLTGQPTPQPTTLAAGRPLLPAPPTNGGADLAPLLRQALSQSGLFYEAHQAKWLSGRTGADALRAEPQGQQPALARNETASAPRVAPTPMSTATNFIGRGGEALAERAAEASQAAALSRGPVVAERLMPVVHQQLDAMATQQYLLHGQAWPGQRFEWELDDPYREGGEGDASEGQDGWDSTLRLTMPRLGALEARLHLTSAGVAIRLVSDDEATAAALEAARDRLDDALSAADVPLTGFVAEVRDDG
tara:strand:+ start:52 stop:1188 length:1137 start_codon:yes stop_codon:yes gene_type:complete